MKKLVLILILFSGLLTMCAKDDSKKNSPTEPEQGFSITEINYHGWENSIEIKNGTTKVVVVPAIGRIMFYGFQNGSNMLWDDPSLYGQKLPANSYSNQGWLNFGGDKVWPTDQSEFANINGHGWPPDHWFDGQAQQYELLEDGVKITSPVSDYCGAYCIREIHLAETGSHVTINQTIKKVKPAQKLSVEPIEFTIWSVTQIVNPEQNLFNMNPASALENGIYFFNGNTAPGNFSLDGNVGVFIPDPSGRNQKAGVDADKWLGAIVGQTAIGEFFELDPGKKYPDNGCSSTVYTSAAYTELELLSPLARMTNGQSMQHTIHWDLTKLSTAGAKAKRDETAEWLNGWWESQ